MDAMQEIRGPKNKKQIGRIRKGDKIYIEDYAVTYLNQIARSPETKSGYAGLFGHCRVVDGIKEYYIYSAIYQESEKTKDGGLPREAVQKIMRKRGENFAEHFFLGWALIYKENTGAMWENCYRSRMETLMGKPELLMTLKCDTCEEHFYLYPTEMPKETEGYFIFYEQNDAMQNFLIGWHGEIHKDKCDDEMDNVAENCRNYYKEKKSRRMRTRLAGVLFAAAAMLLIFAAGVGIQNLNNYDKINETGQVLEELQGTQEIAYNKEQVPIEWEIASETDKENMPALPLDKSESTEVENEEIYDEPVVPEDVELEDTAYIEDAENIGPEIKPESVGDEAVQESDVPEKEEDEMAQESIAPENVVTDADFGNNEVLPVVFPEEYVTYEVAKGDTLYGICLRFYGNLHRAREICELNGIDDMNNILYGQKILLPQ